MDKEVGFHVTAHLLQHTLRSLCMESEWVYAVFWRILPRSYPPPKWDTENGIYDRSKGNKRNWILAWEDGFCDFSACGGAPVESKTGPHGTNGACTEEGQYRRGLQPELFFKMSHEVYNFGEGLMGKIAADSSHKWIYKDPLEHDVNFFSPLHSSIDCLPRTWEAQFKSGIQTIAVIAVRDGLVQLGATKKVIEDLNFVILLQRKFNYLQTIPGVFLPHPSSHTKTTAASTAAEAESGPWNPIAGRLGVRGSSSRTTNGTTMVGRVSPPFINSQNHMMLATAASCSLTPVPVMPSMSSLQALLSKLPSVTRSSSSHTSFLTKSPTFPRHISSPESAILMPNYNIPQSNYTPPADGFPLTCNPLGIRSSDDYAPMDGAGTRAMDSSLSEIVD